MAITIGTYRTRDGRKAVVHDVRLFNDIGAKVSFPVKGTIYTELLSGELGKEHAIWTIDGRFLVTKDSVKDLVAQLPRQ